MDACERTACSHTGYAMLIDVGWGAPCLEFWVGDLGKAWKLDYSCSSNLTQLELGFLASCNDVKTALFPSSFMVWR